MATMTSVCGIAFATSNKKSICMPESAIAKDHPEVVGTPRELGISVTSMVNDIYLNN